MKGNAIIEYIEKSIKGDRVMKKKVLIVGGVAEVLQLQLDLEDLMKTQK